MDQCNTDTTSDKQGSSIKVGLVTFSWDIGGKDDGGKSTCLDGDSDGDWVAQPESDWQDCVEAFCKPNFGPYLYAPKSDGYYKDDIPWPKKCGSKKKDGGTGMFMIRFSDEQSGCKRPFANFNTTDGSHCQDMIMPLVKRYKLYGSQLRAIFY